MASSRRHQPRRHFFILADDIINQGFHFIDFIVIHGARMRKIETQMMLIDQRAFLRHMVAQNAAQASCSKCVAE